MTKHNFVVKAVIFDMDGVITNTMPDHFHAWQKALKHAGIHITFLDIYSREGQRGIISVKELFKKYNKKLTPQIATELLLRKENIFKKISKKKLIPGARAFIKELYKRGFELGLVTGTSRHEMMRILPKDLFHLFKITVTGNDVLKGKPFPEPYLKCLKQMKLRNTEACVIENAPFGIESAKRAGIKCIALKTSLPQKYLKKADVIIRDYDQFKKRIELLLYAF